VPLPKSTTEDTRIKINEVGNNQKLKLFKRGKLISGQPNMRGNTQLPKPPIILGITIKKIINKA